MRAVRLKRVGPPGTREGRAALNPWHPPPEQGKRHMQPDLPRVCTERARSYAAMLQ